MQEIWKDIPGYEGIYQASNFGRIRTVEGKVTHSVRHGIRHWRSRVLKGRGDNYITGRRVSLWKDKKSKDWLVARLVATTFLGAPVGDCNTVNHIDGNRFNNELSNLEWLTIGDNVRHAFVNGLIGTCCTTTLVGGSADYSFPSMSEASRFLGRSSGYLSSTLKRRGYIVKDVRGKFYIVLTSESNVSRRRTA